MDRITGVFELLQDPGPDVIRYAVVAGLIGVAAVVSLTGLTAKFKNAYNIIGNQPTDAVM